MVWKKHGAAEPFENPAGGMVSVPSHICGDAAAVWKILSNPSGFQLSTNAPETALCA